MIKVKAKRSFQWLHKKREVMERIEKGQTFEIDNDDQPEDCMQVLQRGDVIIEDDKFLLVEDFYIARREFAERFGGKLTVMKNGDKVRLSRDVALPLLMSGCILREHSHHGIPDTWCAFRLPAIMLKRCSTTRYRKRRPGL